MILEHAARYRMIAFFVVSFDFFLVTAYKKTKPCHLRYSF